LNVLSIWNPYYGCAELTNWSKANVISSFAYGRLLPGKLIRFHIAATNGCLNHEIKTGICHGFIRSTKVLPC